MLLVFVGQLLRTEKVLASINPKILLLFLA